MRDACFGPCIRLCDVHNGARRIRSIRCREATIEHRRQCRGLTSQRLAQQRIGRTQKPASGIRVTFDFSNLPDAAGSELKEEDGARGNQSFEDDSAVCCNQPAEAENLFKVQYGFLPAA